MDSKANEEKNPTAKDLEIKKLQNDIFLQDLDLQLKQKDIKRKAVFGPTFVTIALAVIGLIGAGITTFLQRNNELEIEDKKFQYAVYEKALESKDSLTAAKILDFYIKAGLLPGEKGKFSKLIDQGKGNEIPTYNGIYAGITTPSVSNSYQFSVESNFLIGKRTTYKLSYNAHDGLNPSKIKAIILHSTGGDAFESATRVMTDSFASKHTSTHLLIDRNGDVKQLVPFNFVAYHAGTCDLGITNGTTIGIMFVNDNTTAEKYTEAQVKVGLEICKLLMKKYAIKSIVAHSEVALPRGRRTDPGQLFPINEFKALVKQ
jgi:hypothetical protein